MRFYEWDYDRGVCIQWERKGECNSCGQCCIKGGEIVFDVADSSEIEPNVYLHDFDSRNGGDMVNKQGQWSQVGNGGDAKFFGNIRHDPSAQGVNHDACPLLKNGLCSIHDDKPLICSAFPMSPAQIATFDECSYTFEQINEWDIEDIN